MSILAANSACTLSTVVRHIQIGLAWDESKHDHIDLDASCVLFDSNGNLIDGVYFNQLRSGDGSVAHSGDSKTGDKSGYDESLFIDLHTVHAQVKALVICITSYSGAKDLPAAARADVRDITIPEAPLLVTMPLSWREAQSAFIVCRIARSDDNPGEWILTSMCRGVTPTHTTAEGKVKKIKVKTFMDILPQLLDTMRGVIPDEVLRERQQMPLKSFPMKKGQYIAVPPQFTRLAVGLGWDAPGDGGVDVDASAAIYNHEGHHIENVYYGNKVSREHAIRSSGDNRTGAGSGDDETIYVNLDKVSSDTYTIVFVITIFTGGYTFADIRSAYARLYIEDTKAEICKYTLTGMSKKTALVLAKIVRSGDCWNVEAIGDGAKGSTISAVIETGKLKKYVERSPLPPPVLVSMNPAVPIPPSYLFTHPNHSQISGYAGPPVQAQNPISISNAHKLAFALDAVSPTAKADIKIVDVNLAVKQTVNVKPTKKELKLKVNELPMQHEGWLRIGSDVRRVVVINRDYFNAAIAEIINPLFNPIAAATPVMVPVLRIQRMNVIPMLGTEVIPKAPVAVAVTVHEAKNLLAKDSNGFSDPFCVVHDSNRTLFEWKTDVKKKTLTPSWDMTFNGMFRSGANIVFTVYDWDRFSNNDLIGSVTLSPAEMIKNQETKFTGWLELKGGSQAAGSIRVTVVLTYE